MYFSLSLSLSYYACIVFVWLCLVEALRGNCFEVVIPWTNERRMIDKAIMKVCVCVIHARRECVCARVCALCV